MHKVGFIGVGDIGTPMASRLLRAGYQMVIYDICKAQTKILQKDGAEVASSPGRLASQCGTILLSLPNSEIVAEVALGVDGISSGASKGTKVIDLTSGHPNHTISIASRLASKGIGMIDAGSQRKCHCRRNRHTQCHGWR